MSRKTRIILVNARNPLNIGAAARAMANFGFEDLALVNPYDPAWQEARSAVGAQELLHRAKTFATVEDAVRDCNLVLGTTSGQRRSLELENMALPQLPGFLESKIPAGRLGVLFGSEKTGLLNEHLAFCHATVTIPTDKQTPSMNLSHAVAVCCYVLARGGQGKPAARAKAPKRPDMAEVERVSGRLLRLYQLADFQKGASDAVKREWIRRIFLELDLGRDRILQAGTLLERIIKKLEGRG
ncbi:MAG: RNA methyltransferase [Elusimicrobia bacterium]|nr:RNA methyltransferase [Elusimicrobiota bacterium]